MKLLEFKVRTNSCLYSVSDLRDIFDTLLYGAAFSPSSEFAEGEIRIALYDVHEDEAKERIEACLKKHIRDASVELLNKFSTPE